MIRTHRDSHRPMTILYLLADRGHHLTVLNGCRIHVLKILEGLKKTRHRPFLVTVNDGKELPGFRDYLCVPLPYLRFFVDRVLPYTGTLDSMAVLFNCLRLHRHLKFDLIHERYGLYTYAGVLMSKILRNPLVLEVNAALVDEKQLFTAPLQRRAKSHCFVCEPMLFRRLR